MAKICAPRTARGAAAGYCTPGAGAAANRLAGGALDLPRIGESLHMSAAGQASAAAYLASGDRLARLMDGVWKL
jgi:hypothetical protein